MSINTVRLTGTQCLSHCRRLLGVLLPCLLVMLAVPDSSFAARRSKAKRTPAPPFADMNGDGKFGKMDLPLVLKYSDGMLEIKLPSKAARKGATAVIPTGTKFKSAESIYFTNESRTVVQGNVKWPSGPDGETIYIDFAGPAEFRGSQTFPPAALSSAGSITFAANSKITFRGDTEVYGADVVIGSGAALSAASGAISIDGATVTAQSGAIIFGALGVGLSGTAAISAATVSTAVGGSISLEGDVGHSNLLASGFQVTGSLTNSLIRGYPDSYGDGSNQRTVVDISATLCGSVFDQNIDLTKYIERFECLEKDDSPRYRDEYIGGDTHFTLQEEWEFKNETFGDSWMYQNSQLSDVDYNPVTVYTNEPVSCSSPLQSLSDPRLQKKVNIPRCKK